MKHILLIFVAMAATMIGSSQAKALNNLEYALAVNYDCKVNYYVSMATGSDSNSGKTEAAAWKTISHAEDALSQTKQPGTCINVAPGIYKENVFLYAGGNANTPTGYTVLRCTTVPTVYAYALTGGVDGTKPACLINGPGGQYVSGIVSFQASYQIIDGFDITTTDITGQEAGIEGGFQTPNSNTGICPSGAGFCHHLAVYRCRVHDVGGAGIQMAWGAAWYIQGNEVFNTVSRQVNQTSGITLCCTSGQTYSGGLENTFGKQNGVNIQNLVTNNVSHNNVIGPLVTGGHTDGEGIIVDTLGQTQSTCLNQNKTGTLLYGNITYGNGGQGVSVFFSSYVAVYNNTSYNNFLDKLNPATARSEFSNLCGHDNTYANNVGVGVVVGSLAPFNSDIGAISGTAGRPGTEPNVLWTNNVFNTNVATPRICTSSTSVVCAYNGDVIAATINRYALDPIFAKPTGSPPNLMPGSGSPLWGKSSATSTVSALGGARVPAPNIGAY